MSVQGVAVSYHMSPVNARVVALENITPVETSGDQTISGEKTFADNVYVGGNLDYHVAQRITHLENSSLNSTTGVTVATDQAVTGDKTFTGAVSAGNGLTCNTLVSNGDVVCNSATLKLVDNYLKFFTTPSDQTPAQLSYGGSYMSINKDILLSNMSAVPVGQRLDTLELDTYERNSDGVTIETTTSSTTKLFDANSNWNDTPNNPLGNGVYQIYVFQRSSGAYTVSAQNKVQHLQARFPLVISSSLTSDQNGPLQQLHGAVFTNQNKHNGAVQFFLKYPTTSSQNPWEVHMLFTAATTDGSGNKDNLNLTIKVKKEVW